MQDICLILSQNAQFISCCFQYHDDWEATNYAVSVDGILRQTVSFTEDLATVDILNGKTFVVTGDLFRYENRDALKEIIEVQGGKLTGSVSSKTTALITNFPDSGTTKIKKAQELGIEIITEEEFIHRYLSE